MSIGIRIAQGVVVAAAATVLWFVFSPPRQKVSPPLEKAGDRLLMSEIHLKDLDGHAWRLEDQLGKVVIVNFWATWCPPCREETPGLIRLANAYDARGLKIVGIAMDEGESTPVVQFTNKYRIPYPILLPDKNFDLANRVDNLPTTFLIDRRGRIARTYVGSLFEQTFKQDVDRLLTE